MVRVDKWKSLKRWLIDNHHEIVRNRIPCVDKFTGKTFEHEQILNILDKMDEIERDEIEQDRQIRLKDVERGRYGNKSI